MATSAGRWGLRNRCSTHRIFKYSRDWVRARSSGRMKGIPSGMTKKERRTMEVKALLTVACAALALPLAAQRQGPLPPPPPGAVAPSGASGDPANTNAVRQETSSHITNEPPALPAEQRSEEHTSELQSLRHLVCRLLLEKKK